MRDILMQINHWLEASKPVVLATVVDVLGSSLRPMGSKMAMTDHEEIIGSVSGGCVEAAVYEQAQEVFRRGKPRLLNYGVSDEDAWNVGLTCGGSIQVLIELLGSSDSHRIFELLSKTLQDNQMVAQVTVLDGELIGRHLLVWPDGSFEGDMDFRIGQSTDDIAGTGSIPKPGCMSDSAGYTGRTDSCVHRGFRSSRTPDRGWRGAYRNPSGAVGKNIRLSYHCGRRPGSFCYPGAISPCRRISRRMASRNLKKA